MSAQVNQEASELVVTLEFTPNPNTLKYAINRPLLAGGAVNFKSLKEAQERSPLATELLTIAGIAGVMIGKDFITITKNDEGDWSAVHQKAMSLIQDCLSTGGVVLHPMEVSAGGEQQEGIESKIREILERDIRPAVAMDGGDIVFDRYEDGIVYLDLQGSCSGCPSATATLKMGVETRLKQAIPEVIEVVAI